MQKIKKIPYGTTDFAKIQKDNYYYIDKTQYIELIEEAPDFLFLIRPRRFGKSLFLSLLESYYDLLLTDEFKILFKGTYIGKNPTEKRNKYLILKFNFAAVDPIIENTKKSFDLHCENVCLKFFSKYQSLFTKEDMEAVKKQADATSKLSTLFRVTQAANQKIYLIIDEYDNFTNSILANSTKSYDEITNSETGFFKHFFNVIKTGTTATDAPVSKMFITGVSPITLDDVTSGGIGYNLTTDLNYNEIIGFTEAEVRELLQYYKDAGKISADVQSIMKFMKKWYNNYRFSEDADNCLFNSTMALNFISRYISIDKFPKHLIDDNTKIDYNKLKHLLILDKKLNGNFSVLQEILENNWISSKIQSSFSIKDIGKRDNFISLLYYFGLITIDDYQRDKYVLKIPNEAIKDFFTNYIKEGFEDAGIFKLDIYRYSDLMTGMAYDGSWKEVFLFLSEAVKKQSKIRDYIKGEAMIKGFLLAYLNITNNYTITSEKELSKGNVDLWLEPVFTTHAKAGYSYLIELKYNKRCKPEEMQKRIPGLIKEATEQLNQYEKDPIIVKEKTTTDVKKIILIYNAWELVHLEEVE
jgi:hypothetical protein